MLKIRRPLGRLIFNMGIAIPGKTVFLIETAPWVYWNQTQLIVLSYLVPADLSRVRYHQLWNILQDIIMNCGIYLHKNLITRLVCTHHSCYMWWSLHDLHDPHNHLHGSMSIIYTVHWITRRVSLVAISSTTILVFYQATATQSKSRQP